MRSPRLVPPVLVFSVFVLAACQTAAPTAVEKVQAPAYDVVSFAAAQNIANNCFSCHGPEGRSPGAIPGLNRLSADNIVTRLRGFKNGTEPSTVMTRHAKAYTDAEIEAVAHYIAGLKK